MKLFTALASAFCLVSAFPAVAVEETLAGPVGPAGWISSIDDERKCRVTRADDLIVIKEGGPRSIRINVNLVGVGADLIGSTAPVSVSFRGAKGKPDIIWSDIAYHTGLGIYFDLSLQLQPDFEALHYMRHATIMDVRFGGQTHKFALAGSSLAIDMFSNCMTISGNREQAEVDAFLDKLK